MFKRLLLLSGGILVAGTVHAEPGKIPEVYTVDSPLLDLLWVLISAALVFFMQAGFKAFEVGLVRKNHRDAIGLKNVVDWIVGSLVFFLIGFGFMFGKSWNGLIGTDLFFGNNIVGNPEGNGLGYVFFIFQVAFAGTALTIISGAMSERTGFIPYITGSMFTALLIYPIFGHWAWGDLFYEDNKPWLSELGFMDFAGSTVVHSVGAWVALVGVIFVGPRLGRFDIEGNSKKFRANNFAYAALGLFILWLGWWGFNGGSELAFNENVGTIILNTNLAGAMAGLVSFYYCYLFQSKNFVYEKFLGGTIGGLVAITAGCNVVSPLGALVIGFTTGIIHNLSFDLLMNKLKLDDPVGAIPVHGFCGAWGTLSVGLFGKQELLNLPRFEQIGIQLLGIIVCFAFTASVAYAVFYFLKKTVGLRVSPEQESQGMILGNPEIIEEKTEDLSKDELIKLMMEAEGKEN